MRHPELKLKIPAHMFCVSWCNLNLSSWGTQGDGRAGCQGPAVQALRRADGRGLRPCLSLAFPLPFFSKTAPFLAVPGAPSPTPCRHTAPVLLPSLPHASLSRPALCCCVHPPRRADGHARRYSRHDSARTSWSLAVTALRGQVLEVVQLEEQSHAHSHELVPNVFSVLSARGTRR